MRPRLATVATAVALALGAVAAAACNTGDGRQLRPPLPGATRPPLPTSSTTAGPVIGPPVGSSDSSSGLALASASFAEGGTIPDRLACPENVSPALSWSGVPEATVELAIVVTDPDAGGFVHWVLARVDPAVTGLAEGGVPEGAVEARNDTSEFGWFGPCPPEGESHRYVFTLHALSAPSGIEPGAGAADAITAITAASTASASLTGTYP